ncbi:MAG: sulfate ABC transporter permease subunit CysT, partial [Microbacteriaceae bacterium]|nr:sulfate ABC transporter permease subunit CysT [Microbacteriaceae bacterium]
MTAASEVPDLPLPRRRRVLPGFGLTLGLTLTWLGLVIVLPLAALVAMSLSGSDGTFWRTVTSDRALAAYRLSFGAAGLAALVNLVGGSATAWVLVRYRFPGRALVDALIDIPFALPTAVAGIALTQAFDFDSPIPLANTFGGVTLALVFVGLPFVIRTVQPVLASLPREAEEAAATLGASRWRTVRTVVLPALGPALVTGFALSFARAVGEYGSVVFISGNLPFETEIAPLLIMT